MPRANRRREMKKVKAAFWLVVLLFIGILVYQNWEYFSSQHSLSINLPLVDPYQIPESPNYLLFLICLLIGLLLPYIYSLVERFRLNKMIKKLSETTAAQQEEISGLKRELEMVQNRSVEDVPEADLLSETTPEEP